MLTTKLMLWLVLLLRSGGSVFNVRCHQRSLSLRVPQDHLAGLLDDRWLGSTPESLILYIWCRAQEFEFSLTTTF